MDAASSGEGRVEEGAEDGVFALPVFAPAHPRAGAISVGRRGRFVAVVGRVAEADDDRHCAFDFEGLDPLVGDGPQEEP